MASACPRSSCPGSSRRGCGSSWITPLRSLFASSQAFSAASSAADRACEGGFSGLVTVVGYSGARQLAFGLAASEPAARACSIEPGRAARGSRRYRAVRRRRTRLAATPSGGNRCCPRERQRTRVRHGHGVGRIRAGRGQRRRTPVRPSTLYWGSSLAHRSASAASMATAVPASQRSAVGQYPVVRTRDPAAAGVPPGGLGAVVAAVRGRFCGRRERDSAVCPMAMVRYVDAPDSLLSQSYTSIAWIV